MRKPIITYSNSRINQERIYSAMAEMVDIDSFLLALDDIEKLTKFILFYNWTQLEDYFPEKEQIVIIYSKKNKKYDIGYMSNYYNDDDNFYSAKDGMIIDNPSHWMPLSEPDEE